MILLYCFGGANGRIFKLKKKPPVAQKPPNFLYTKCLQEMENGGSIDLASDKKPKAS